MPAFLSTKAAALELGISQTEVREELKRGHLDAARQGRRVLVTRESLDIWIEAKCEEARQARARQCGQEYLRGSFRPAPTQINGSQGGRGIQALMAAAHGSDGGRTDETKKRRSSSN